MRTPTPWWRLAALLVILPLQPLQGQAVEEESARIQRVEHGLLPPVGVRGMELRFDLEQRMRHHGVPGVSVAVVDDGRLAWAKAYGVTDAATGAPVTPETLFQAASISKPVAALAALRLVEQGLLELDAPVNRYLKRWKIPENPRTRRQPVTLRHLLSHTAGLTVHGFPGYPRNGERPGVLEILDGLPPANTPQVLVDTIPGDLWRYSGGGYTVLQLLLEDVTGKAFPALMEKLVLGPAGMTSSSFVQPLPDERIGLAAAGHDREGRRVEGGWHDYPELAAAGLWSTPTDLARLAIEIQRTLRGESDRIISAETARLMLTPVKGGWGLGFAVRGDEGAAAFTHGGSNFGFKAQFVAFVEDGKGAVVMTNGDDGGALAQEILHAIAEEYHWKGFKQELRDPGGRGAEPGGIPEPEPGGIPDAEPRGKGDSLPARGPSAEGEPRASVYRPAAPGRAPPFSFG